MARLSREVSPTGYYHIMMRGINKEMIFKNNFDKKNFLSLIETKFEEDVLIVAFCIMDNHVHIILKGELDDISLSLRRINTSFAMRINRSLDRVGHVFQDRYKSEIIHNEAHLLCATRYVHNNPVKAGIIKSPQQYDWSSYSHFLQGKSNLLDSGEIERIMKSIGSNKQFQDFHKLEDEIRFIDTKEELDRLEYSRAQRIIHDYHKNKVEIDSQSIRRNSDEMDQLIGMLLENTNLSIRKVSELLEVSKSTVHRLSRGGI
ncbi:transposase [Gudongella sp. DL1XJH-153]|uniref:transposase n=1 Tax=Gudongella sp. DL1XJH-153 TaxID=3409804 RepID=UPI003BB48BFB